MPVIDFDPPERFVAGAVGPPGQRTFFLQARSGDRIVSVSCEKEQVTVLAERLDDLLDQMAGEDASADVAADLVDNEALDTPIQDEFRVVALTLGWDPARSAIVVEAHERSIDESDGDGDDAPVEPSMADPDQTVVRVVLAPSRAREFARRCRAVIAAGRPACPLCGNPLDPAGHVCPRANGYRR